MVLMLELFGPTIVRQQSCTADTRTQIEKHLMETQSTALPSIHFAQSMWLLVTKQARLSF